MTALECVMCLKPEAESAIVLNVALCENPIPGFFLSARGSILPQLDSITQRNMKAWMSAVFLGIFLGSWDVPVWARSPAFSAGVIYTKENAPPIPKLGELALVDSVSEFDYSGRLLRRRGLDGL